MSPHKQHAQAGHQAWSGPCRALLQLLGAIFLQGPLGWAHIHMHLHAKRHISPFTHRSAVFGSAKRFSWLPLAGLGAGAPWLEFQCRISVRLAAPEHGSPPGQCIGGLGFAVWRVTAETYETDTFGSVTARDSTLSHHLVTSAHSLPNHNNTFYSQRKRQTRRKRGECARV